MLRLLVVAAASVTASIASTCTLVDNSASPGAFLFCRAYMSGEQHAGVPSLAACQAKCNGCEYVTYYSYAKAYHGWCITFQAGQCGGLSEQPDPSGQIGAATYKCRVSGAVVATATATTTAAAAPTSTTTLAHAQTTTTTTTFDAAAAASQSASSECVNAPQHSIHYDADISGQRVCCPSGWVLDADQSGCRDGAGATCFLLGGGIDGRLPCPSLQAHAPGTWNDAAPDANAGSIAQALASGLTPAGVEPVASGAFELQPVGVAPVRTAPLLPAGCHTPGSTSCDTIPSAWGAGNLCSHTHCRAEKHTCSRWSRIGKLHVAGRVDTHRHGCTGAVHYSIRVFHHNGEGTCDARHGHLCGLGVVTGDRTHCECRPANLHGGWSDWSSWGACTVSCGDGVKLRRRSCTNPVPRWGGQQCTADGSKPTELAPCKEQSCPDRGPWLSWSAWSKCSKSCGGGTHTRKRVCDSAHGSSATAFAVRVTGDKKERFGNCEGDAQQTQPCGQSLCPVDGGWSNWSRFTVCSRTCGRGTKTRSRSCTIPAPQHGGKVCEGDSELKRACALAPCPIIGAWRAWSNWTTCTKSCGTGGTHYRFRRCNNPDPHFGGTGCTGPTRETRSCNQFSCPIDGGWATWSSWSACSKTCGGGTRTRSRGCSSPSPQHGGKACVGKDAQADSCAEKKCEGFTAYTKKLHRGCATIVQAIEGGDHGTANHFTCSRACTELGAQCHGYQMDMDDAKYGGCYLMRKDNWHYGCAGEPGLCDSGWCFFEKGGPRPQPPAELLRRKAHVPYSSPNAYRGITGDCGLSNAIDRMGSHHPSLLREKCEQACDSHTACVGISMRAGENFCFLRGPGGHMDAPGMYQYGAGDPHGRCGQPWGVCPQGEWCFFEKQAESQEGGAHKDEGDDHACCERQCAATYTREHDHDGSTRHGVEREHGYEHEEHEREHEHEEHEHGEHEQGEHEQGEHERESGHHPRYRPPQGYHDHRRRLHDGDVHTVEKLVSAWRALCYFGCRAPHVAPVREYCGEGEALLRRPEFARFNLERSRAAHETSAQICATGVAFRDVCLGDSR